MPLKLLMSWWRARRRTGVPRGPRGPEVSAFQIDLEDAVVESDLPAFEALASKSGVSADRLASTLNEICCSTVYFRGHDWTPHTTRTFIGSVLRGDVGGADEAVDESTGRCFLAGTAKDFEAGLAKSAAFGRAKAKAEEARKAWESAESGDRPIAALAVVAAVRDAAKVEFDVKRRLKARIIAEAEGDRKKELIANAHYIWW